MKQISFAKLKPLVSLPDLLELQKNSFEDFLQANVAPKDRKKQGLHQAFLDVFGDESKGEGLVTSDGSLTLQYLYYVIDEPRRTPDEARDRDMTYESQLKVWFRFLQKLETGKIKELAEQEIYLCELPVMTESGSFVINGAERVVVAQIHRSPGVIFEEDEEKKVSQLGKKLYKASVIPYRGAWLDFEYDLNNILYVHIDKKRKIPVTTLLRAIGIESNEEIIKLFYTTETLNKRQFEHAETRVLAEDAVDRKTGEVIRETGQEIRKEHINILKEKVEEIEVIKFDPILNDITVLYTLQADPARTRKEAVDIIYKILRTAGFITPEIAKDYLDNLLFKPRKYGLTKVGRYKLNKKLGSILGELEEKHKDFNFTVPSEKKHTLTKEDIIATIKYIINLNNGAGGEIDDIDHLGNRRIRAVGELLENQVRIGLINLARFTRDRMNAADKKSLITPRNVVNPTSLVIFINRFFGTSQLSQFLDQTNPLAEITHKRRFSALGPGGLHRKRAGFEVRDVHYTHYGRICPIETPEGPNIGLITSMACYARVNEYGLIETPYCRVANGKLSDKVEYMTADREDEYVIAQANTELDRNNRIAKKSVSCMYRGDVKVVAPQKVDFMDISPKQVVSLSTALIPFLEHDDANRALMGSNMQRQAVPLFITEEPLIATGVEEKIAKDSYAVITAQQSGEVVSVTANQIAVYNDDDKVDIYRLKKYIRTNQDTCINFIPIVSKGDKVKKGEVIADGPGTSNGKIALGKNVLVAFMSWEGYNFEDAVVMSERLVREDIFTSVHIKVFRIEARDTKIGPEEITRDIPNVGADDLLNLDESGIVRMGAEVGPGDILVGKTAPKGEQQITMEERLLKAIFGKKAEDVVDESLRVPPGVRGKVIGIEISVRWEKMTRKNEAKRLEEINATFKNLAKDLKEKSQNAVSQKQDKEEREKIKKYYAQKEKELEEKKKKEQKQIERGDELPITVNKVVKVYISARRKIQVGDKIAGRHGNKGVVGKILPVEDMPYLPDGTPVDMILSPLSVPSRMNVGQLMETMLGWAAKFLNVSMICPVFESATEEEIIEKVREAKTFLRSKEVPEKYLPTDDCRITLYDGRTGEPFMEKITIGYMYMMKLGHLVEDKIHARSTGPYSLITRQPLGGKAQFGGQRLGEMEVWALEGYGAAHTLQEFLTVKSDDVIGRTRVYESIIKGEVFSETGVPESFIVLVRELQGLGLNIELLHSSRGDKEIREVKESRPEPVKASVPIKTL